jgi:hypothetical protein
MITNPKRKALRELGCSEEEIRWMTPQQANEILSARGGGT